MPAPPASPWPARCAERGIAYDQVERHSGVGGVWDIDAPGTPMYESAHFISSRTVSGFSDHPMPDDFPDYPHHRQILAYLRGFAERYGLTGSIRFGTEVTALERDLGRWRVGFADGGWADYESVVVCTGAQWTPNRPEVPGYTGELRHSVTYRSPAEFAGRRVLVVGGGNSACDIACDAAQNAERAVISMRRGYWFIPKHVFGVPSDIVGGKGSFLPKPLERALLQPLLRLLVGDLTRLGLAKPDHKLFETHPLLNDQLLHHLRHGDITARPGIARAEGTRITFADGNADDVDLVLLATGYQQAVPFAQDLFGDPQHPDDLYLSAFSRRHPGLYTVGFVETNSGAFHLFDRQAHLIAGYLAEREAGTDKAAAFADRIRTDRPRLNNGLRFDRSPRHTGYVDSDAYVAYLDRTGAEFGWPLASEGAR